MPQETELRSLSKVVWWEGMHLAPHHFQRQSRFFENSLHFTASSLRFAAYGFAGLELDADALKNGSISIRHARGVFRDGLVFDIPESDPPPKPLRLTDDLFPPTADSHFVSLAIPSGRLQAGSIATATARSADGFRYISETSLLRDELTGQDEKAVELGRKNFSVILDTDRSEDLVRLPFARVRRAGARQFGYDPTFVPPLLSISANEHLMEMLKRLCILIEEKASAAAGPDDRDARSLGERYQRDLIAFWYLHTLYSHLAPLRHLMLARNKHPEDLFIQMLSLAGALACFVVEANPRDLPVYDHDALGSCFEVLETKIRSWLQIMLPVPCISIPAIPSAASFWRAPISDERHFHRSRWVLEIQSPKAGIPNVMAQAPRLVKLCSDRFIVKLVSRAVAGLPLAYLPAPPPEIPVGEGGVCFELSKTGPCWEDIMQTGQVGFYVPDALPDPRLILHIVPER